ncbi:UpxY family transcription antiterminator [Lacinutrix sp. MEBiC02404]
MQDKKWYVLYVKRNHEKKVEKLINAWGEAVLAFCPTRTELRVWSDRKKKIQVPLLPRIIFIHATEEMRAKVFDIPGTLNYLYDQGEPGVVRDVEIEFLKNNLESLDVKSHTLEAFTPGTTLFMDDFGLDNQKGLIVKSTKNNLWVVLKSVGFVVKLQLN